MWTDELSAQYADLLDGSYNCVDRIVLNAYCTLCYSAGGFRTWWRRLHDGSDDELDDNHLMPHGWPVQPPCVRIRKSARHSRHSMQHRTTKASDRGRVPAEDACSERIISHSCEPCGGACLDGEAFRRWRYPEP